MPFWLVAWLSEARLLGEASDWNTLMNSAWASLLGSHIAIFDDSGVQRSIGCVAVRGAG